VVTVRRSPFEFGALAPKYVSRPGTGWDALFGMMGNVLREQVLYGRLADDGTPPRVGRMARLRARR
jgi:hypothetical protein